MIRALVVYDRFPADTKFYRVYVTPEEWSWIKLCHRQYGNIAGMEDASAEACERLLQWMEEAGKVVRIQELEMSSAQIIDASQYDYVIHTGYLL